MKHQRKVIDKWRKDGFFVINLIATNHNGIPDLLALKEGEVPTFIECKEKWDKVSPLQLFIHEQLQERGFKVIVEWNR